MTPLIFLFFKYYFCTPKSTKIKVLSHKKEVVKLTTSSYAVIIFRLCLRNSFSRALGSASAAVDAGICIDYILAVSFGNCICRTLSLACTTHYTIITNYICHSFFLLKSVFSTSEKYSFTICLYENYSISLVSKMQ